MKKERRKESKEHRRERPGKDRAETRRKEGKNLKKHRGERDGKETET